jgi:hypothetical protein
MEARQPLHDAVWAYAPEWRRPNGVPVMLDARSLEPNLHFSQLRQHLQDAPESISPNGPKYWCAANLSRQRK